MTEFEQQPNPVRLRVDDFDGDGNPDALTYSNSIRIGWSFLTQARWDTLVAEEDYDLRDITVVNQGGDGDLDLVFRTCSLRPTDG